MARAPIIVARTARVLLAGALVNASAVAQVSGGAWAIGR